MEREELLKKIKAIIADKLSISEDQVTEEASFIDDLGADSLDTVELVMALEDEFDLDIPDEVIRTYKRFIYFQKPGGNFLESLFNNFLNKVFLGTEAKNKIRFDCGELRDLIYIFPNADLVACGLRQKVIANLLEEDFEEIWSSRKIKKYRAEIRDCPGCLQKSIKLISRIYKVF